MVPPVSGAPTDREIEASARTDIRTARACTVIGAMGAAEAVLLRIIRES
ncbi:hypothetical protein ACIRJR_00875 [Streptomyces sp. NPDC102402]